jgi:hypothetical protein
VFVGVSQPFDPRPSQFSVEDGQATHAPAEQLCAVPAHASVAPHAPLVSHVWTPFPAHCLLPGVQTPVHAPLTQADDAQVAAAPHCPFVSHVWTPLLKHWTEPGVQTPVHAPPTQAWFAQAAPLCQIPVGPHVWGVSPLHCFAPAVQLPEHEPPLQTPAHAAPLTHVPVASQV